MELHELNTLSIAQLKEELTKCCGSASWVKKMLQHFPAKSTDNLLRAAEKEWDECNETDWKEAFTHHPKIGDLASLKKKFASTAQWASGEQSAVHGASEGTLEALAEGNRLYEEKFGYIFIICATGKGAGEMLNELESRLLNTEEEEILVAAAEQNKITQLRLKKLLS